MTGVLFDGGMRRAPKGRVGQVWRECEDWDEWPRRATPLCGQTLDYPIVSLLDDGKISRACRVCLDLRRPPGTRLDREAVEREADQ